MGSVLEPGQDLQGSCTVSPADQSQAGSFVFPCVLVTIGRSQQPILGLFVVPGMGSRALCKHLTSEPCLLPFYYFSVLRQCPAKFFRPASKSRYSLDLELLETSKVYCPVPLGPADESPASAFQGAWIKDLV